MAREFEDTENAKDAQRDERSTEVLVVADAQPDVVRQNCDDVDDAHDRADVATPGGRGVQSQQVLDSEDDDAGRVEAEQLDAVAFATRLEPAGPDHWRPARNRLDDVGGDGQRNKEAGDVIEHERRRARLRVLERLPQLLSRRRFRLNFLASFSVNRQRYLISRLRTTNTSS